MRRIKGDSNSKYAILLPTSEWEQVTIFGLQERSPLLARRRHAGRLRATRLRARGGLVRLALPRGARARSSSYTQLGNPYQEFSRGYIAMWITGPWNLGEFRRRLAARAAGHVDDRARAGAGRAGVAGVFARGRVLDRALPGLEAEGRRLALRRVPLAARDPDALLRALRRSAGAQGVLGRSRRSPTTRRRAPSATSSRASRRCRACPSGSRSRRSCGRTSRARSGAARPFRRRSRRSTATWISSSRSGAGSWRARRLAHGR